MSDYQLAQLNIGFAKDSADSELLADFAAQLDPVNEAAEQSPGFIWRLKGDNNNATGFNAFDEENMLINISVWESVEHLQGFMYSEIHMNVWKDKARWFEVMDSANVVLWWIKADAYPTIDEALERLSHLSTHGPTVHAFTFKETYPKPSHG